MLTLAKHSISPYAAGNCQEDAVILRNKMKKSVNQKLKAPFPLVHTCSKDMQQRSKHNPIIWAWRSRAKLKFRTDIHWLKTIQYFITKMAVFWHNCLAGLLSGSCSDLLPDVLTWICTVYTQDLKPYTQAIVYHRNQRNQRNKKNKTKQQKQQVNGGPWLVET